MKRLQVAAMALAITLAGAPCRGDERTFERDVLPILSANCLTCHGGIRQRGELDLRTLESAKAGGKSGAALVAGASEKSLLWKKVAADEMPKAAPKLSHSEKEILRSWLDRGAKSLADVEGAPAPLVKRPVRAPSDIAAALDAEIDRHLEQAGVRASPLADDGEFLRRVYLDLTGRIPTIEQAEAFLASTNPDRRGLLIDELLESPSFASHFATIWHNLLIPLVDNKRVYDEPIFRWLMEGFAQNRPWDRTVTELITATGNTETNPTLGFLIANKEPFVLATRSAKLFLGLRLECAECHNHPFSTWKQENVWGMAAFFQPLLIKKLKFPEKGINAIETNPPVKDYVGPRPAIKLPDTAGPRASKVIAARFLDDTEPAVMESGSYRTQLAQWISGPNNLHFPKASVNRLWGQLFGRGLVHPVDDLEAGNQPIHPKSLETLAQEFVSSGYDLKHVLRCICRTKAYRDHSQKGVVFLPLGT